MVRAISNKDLVNPKIKKAKNLKTTFKINVNEKQSGGKKSKKHKKHKKKSKITTKEGEAGADDDNEIDDDLEKEDDKGDHPSQPLDDSCAANNPTPV